MQPPSQRGTGCGGEGVRTALEKKVGVYKFLISDGGNVHSADYLPHFFKGTYSPSRTFGLP
jgi:hypothetical protein